MCPPKYAVLWCAWGDAALAPHWEKGDLLLSVMLVPPPVVALGVAVAAEAAVAAVAVHEPDQHPWMLEQEWQLDGDDFGHALQDLLG